MQGPLSFFPHRLRSPPFCGRRSGTTLVSSSGRGRPAFEGDLVGLDAAEQLEPVRGTATRPRARRLPRPSSAPPSGSSSSSRRGARESIFTTAAQTMRASTRRAPRSRGVFSGIRPMASSAIRNQTWSGSTHPEGREKSPVSGRGTGSVRVRRRSRRRPLATCPRPTPSAAAASSPGVRRLVVTVMSRTSAPLRQPDDGCPYDRHRRLGSLETPAYAAGVDAVMCSAAQLHGVHGSRFACVLSGRSRAEPSHDPRPDGAEPEFPSRYPGPGSGRLGSPTASGSLLRHVRPPDPIIGRRRRPRA